MKRFILFVQLVKLLKFVINYLYKKYQIYAVDGSIFKCAINNLNGKNVSSIALLAMLNVSNNMISNYNIAYDTNETKSLLELKQSLSFNHLLIMDRAYSNQSFIDPKGYHKPLV